MLVLLFVATAIFGVCWNSAPSLFWNLPLDFCDSILAGIRMLAVAWVGLRKGNVGRATWIWPILLVALCPDFFTPISPLMTGFQWVDWLRFRDYLIWLGLFWVVHRAFGFCILPSGVSDQPKRLSIGFLLTTLTLVAIVLALDARLGNALNRGSNSDRTSSLQLAEILFKLQTLSEPVMSGLGLVGVALLFVKGKRAKLLGFIILFLSGSANVLLSRLLLIVSLFPGVSRFQTIGDAIVHAAAIELTRLTIVTFGLCSVRLAGYSIAIGGERTQNARGST